MAKRSRIDEAGGRTEYRHPEEERRWDELRQEAIEKADRRNRLMDSVGGGIEARVAKRLQNERGRPPK